MVWSTGQSSIVGTTPGGRMGYSESSKGKMNVELKVLSTLGKSKNHHSPTNSFKLKDYDDNLVLIKNITKQQINKILKSSDFSSKQNWRKERMNNPKHKQINFYWLFTNIYKIFITLIVRTDQKHSIPIYLFKYSIV